MTLYARLVKSIPPLLLPLALLLGLGVTVTWTAAAPIQNTPPTASSSPCFENRR